MYLYLSQKVHVSKNLFHPKISPINMAMYPLFAVQPRGQDAVARTGEDATSDGLHRCPAILPCLNTKEVGGGWSYIFFVFPNFYFYIMARFQLNYS